MKLLFLLITIFIANLSNATELNHFDYYKVKPTNVRLAVVDTSRFSLDWLQKNKEYLRTEKIPVIVIDGDEDAAKSIYAKFGVLSGATPQPKTFMMILLKQLQIIAYPAVIENDLVWQENPNQIQRSK